jgi:hypothetical protein
MATTLWFIIDYKQHLFGHVMSKMCKYVMNDDKVLSKKEA